MSGIALAKRCRHSGLSSYGFNGLRQGDEHSAFASVVSIFLICFSVSDYCHAVYDVVDCQIQQRFEIEMKKLEELEAEHQETCRNMKGLPEDSDNQTAIVSKYQREQQELEHQRNVVDDLEFQMFEATVFVTLSLSLRPPSRVGHYALMVVVCPSVCLSRGRP